MRRQKIVPHLWFDTQAGDAARFYTSLLPDSNVTMTTTLRGTPTGDAEIVAFDVWGYGFMAISAGPLFTFNPSISFMLNFDPSRDREAARRLDDVWAKLADGGVPLMPLDRYPFSERYGWIQDRFGLSWQLILTNPEGEPRPNVIPSLLFAGDAAGQAEAASDFYLSVFDDTRRGALARYGADQAPEREGTVMFTDFMLEDQWFAAMDSARQHDFQFNEAVSLLVRCETQAEIDRYWQALSAVPAAEQCGWLKDRFGVSWQVAPTAMGRMLSDGTREQIERVTRAFLPMKKFDLAALQRAYHGG